MIERVAAIIPAFNEELNIGTVLRVLKAVPEIDDIIVVNDGSTDQTSRVARELGVRVLDLEENSGKGSALKAGAEQVQADIVLFLDADLLGLTVEHVQELLRPVLNGDHEAT
ncbi:MAG: glycosyltransferase family 2 protein, partial [Sulfobacillus sp.]